MSPVRTLVVWCPDWPLWAHGVAVDQPAAVLRAGRVVAASPAARAHGVARGQRQREAQARCPALTVLDRDDAAEAHRFESVVAALDGITPWVEVRRPGVCAFGVRGPVRVFGGERALVAATRDTVDRALGGPSEARPAPRLGVADGPFAAGLAARAANGSTDRVHVVAAGESRAFLAPQPVGTLGRPGLADVLARLGLTTLGAFAALPAADVLGRFGADGAAAHRLAAGRDEHSPDGRPPPPDLAVAVELDPPVDRVDQAAFVARSLADDLHDGLAQRGLVCTRVIIDAETGHGERLSRRWRDEGALSSHALADRVRWQLDGWLHGPPTGEGARPTAGLTRLALVPDEVVAATGRQVGFWGGASAADQRAARAFTRVAGLLGGTPVRLPEWRGGRCPGERWVPAPVVDGADGPVAGGPVDRPPIDRPPWPGGLPAPSPAAVHVAPQPIEVLDRQDRAVGVDARGALSAPPVGLRVDGRPREVAAWAGPWPVDERWWDPERHRRRARLQVVADDGVARLVELEGGTWRVAATYD